jgi:hypothetical protein
MKPIEKSQRTRKPEKMIPIKEIHAPENREKSYPDKKCEHSKIAKNDIEAKNVSSQKSEK